MKSVRPLLALVGVVALALVFAPGALPQATSKASKGPETTAIGKCSIASARALFKRRSGKNSIHNNAVPDQVLCGPFTGVHSRTMIVSLVGGKCETDSAWLAFRRKQGQWKKVWAYRGVFKFLAAAGTKIKETIPVTKKTDRNCQASGGRQFRLWKWNGKKFVPGSWHRVGGKGSQRGHKRLVLLPRIATIPAGGSAQFRVHLFEGTRDLGDVTSKTGELGMERQSGTGCGASFTPPDKYQEQVITPYCRGLFSCDLATFSCGAINAGQFLVVATSEQLNLDAEANLVVTPKETLAITPGQLEPVLSGLTTEQQLKVSGAEGPVTWEAEILKDGYREPTAEIGWTLDSLTGVLSGTMEPWRNQTTILVRAWDPTGNSGTREYTLSEVNPACAAICVFTGARRSVGIAWKRPPGDCLELILNGTVDHKCGAPTFYGSETALGGGLVWIASSEDEFSPGTLLPHDFGQQPGDTIAAAMYEYVELPYFPFSEMLLRGTSNTAVVK